MHAPFGSSQPPCCCRRLPACLPCQSHFAFRRSCMRTKSRRHQVAGICLVFLLSNKLSLNILCVNGLPSVFLRTKLLLQCNRWQPACCEKRAKPKSPVCLVIWLSAVCVLARRATIAAINKVGGHWRREDKSGRSPQEFSSAYFPDVFSSIIA